MQHLAFYSPPRTLHTVTRTTSLCILTRLKKMFSPRKRRMGLYQYYYRPLLLQFNEGVTAVAICPPKPFTFQLRIFSASLADSDATELNSVRRERHNSKTKMQFFRLRSNLKKCTLKKYITRVAKATIYLNAQNFLISTTIITIQGTLSQTLYFIYGSRLLSLYCTWLGVYSFVLIQKCSVIGYFDWFILSLIIKCNSSFYIFFFIT